jgi:(E)-4-hydroxy-3-methyl-but-2-enyl pyrophosphate reductase
MKKTIKIIVAKHAGFCFGVRRAMEIAERSLTGGETFCLGEIIHNASVVEGLRKKGLKIVEKLEDVPAGSSLIIRSHGVGPEIFSEAEKKKIKIIDATCPFVQKAQKTAQAFFTKNFQVIIIGDKKHPEVIGIKAHTENKALIVNDVKEALRIKNFSQIGLLIQTTGKIESLQTVAAALLQKTNNLTVSNTICLDSFSKKKEVREMKKKVDILLVIGDKNSNNTKKLVEIGNASKIKTYQIESANDIKESWLRNKKNIGITAGASTPDILINQAVKKIKNVTQFL